MRTIIDKIKRSDSSDYNILFHNYSILKSIKKLEKQLEEAKREKALQDI
jgi:hypothetical protein